MVGDAQEMVLPPEKVRNDEDGMPLWCYVGKESYGLSVSWKYGNNCRASAEKYDETADEHRGTNKMISCNEKYEDWKVVEIGEVVRGCFIHDGNGIYKITRTERVR